MKVELNKWYYEEGSIAGHKFKELFMFEEYDPDRWINYKTRVIHWEKHEGPEMGLHTIIDPKLQVKTDITDKDKELIPYEGNPLELIKEWYGISLNAIFGDKDGKNRN